jgi:hypothetical protein
MARETKLNLFCTGPPVFQTTGLRSPGGPPFVCPIVYGII